ncbi:gamma-glutamyltransferase family protein [Nisaea sediminum]|uniref:gamma-glutamyltransferase family protein n=1 Tax=Nisaea sediminum TaxID=2775867 RepID=UPI0018660B5C|nr:gamma-glutamyltransferase [Nisaea sediminum]
MSLPASVTATERVYETWRAEKPAATGKRGAVASQNVEAAAVGQAMLEAGGNAMDAAIATAFALTVAEPWMSGLGGGGFITLYSAKEKAVRVVDFAMKSPKGLDTATYALAKGTGADLFGWPAVVEDRNVNGPHSIAVPGTVAGYALALEKYGSKSLAEIVAPSAALARRGHRVTWWTTLMCGADMPALRKYPTSAEIWLPNGCPPAMDANPAPKFIPMGKLADTLEELGRDGAGSFYRGKIAERIAKDAARFGSTLSMADLEAYEAEIQEPISMTRGGATYYVPAGLTAGPSFADALKDLPEFSAAAPDAATYAAYAKTLKAAYEYRMEHLGHAGDHGDRSCTSHIAAADAEGNIVMITTTLLSRFGSRLLFPETGIMMNNGINWFDPRPGRPNSLKPDTKPLCNMVPAVVTRDGKPWFGFGASGGRKIMPAVFQLCSFVSDFGMDLATALDAPRVDLGAIDTIYADARLDEATLAALKQVAPTESWPPTTYPIMYACPLGAMVGPDGPSAAAHPMTPLAGALAV